MGGLSIYQEIVRLHPDAHYIYAFDNAAFPYGELDDQVLIERVHAFLLPLVEKHFIDIVVIACNTASTLVLPSLRHALAVPVVGVVPAIKPAATLSQKHCIGLLATPATVKRPYIDHLITQFAPDCRVLKLGSTRLVEMGEAKLRHLPISLSELNTILLPLLDRVDCLILGCTHFPLLKSEIETVVGNKVKVIDSGVAIARRVTTLLASTFPRSSERKANITYHTGQLVEDELRELNKSFRCFGLGELKFWDLPFHRV